MTPKPNPSTREGETVRLTKRRLAMLRFLDVVGRPYDGVKPGQVAMLRSMEEQGLVDRGSIVHRKPRWSLTPAGRRALAEGKDVGR